MPLVTLVLRHCSADLTDAVAVFDPDAPVDAAAAPQPVVARLSPTAPVHLDDATFPGSTRPDLVLREVVGLPVVHRRNLPRLVTVIDSVVREPDPSREERVDLDAH